MSIPEVSSRNRLLYFLKQELPGTICGYSRYGAATYITATRTFSTLNFGVDGSGNTHSITFVAPSSGNVEISVTVTVDPLAGYWGRLALSDDPAVGSTAYTPIGALSDTDVIVNYSVFDDYALTTTNWTLPGLTPGVEYTFYLIYASGTHSKAFSLYWGGAFSDLIMQAKVLPETIVTYP